MEKQLGQTRQQTAVSQPLQSSKAVDDPVLSYVRLADMRVRQLEKQNRALLEACRTALNFCESHGVGSTSGIQDQLRAALRLAEGKEPT